MPSNSRPVDNEHLKFLALMGALLCSAIFLFALTIFPRGPKLWQLSQDGIGATAIVTKLGAHSSVDYKYSVGDKTYVGSGGRGRGITVKDQVRILYSQTEPDVSALVSDRESAWSEMVAEIGLAMCAGILFPSVLVFRLISVATKSQEKKEGR
jgi:hypothetical protein